jgi:hypothetical protein
LGTAQQEQLRRGGNSKQLGRKHGAALLPKRGASSDEASTGASAGGGDSRLSIAQRAGLRSDVGATDISTGSGSLDSSQLGGTAQLDQHARQQVRAQQSPWCNRGAETVLSTIPKCSKPSLGCFLYALQLCPCITGAGGARPAEDCGCASGGRPGRSAGGHRPGLGSLAGCARRGAGSQESRACRAAAGGHWGGCRPGWRRGHCRYMA